MDNGPISLDLGLTKKERQAFSFEDAKSSDEIFPNKQTLEPPDKKTSNKLYYEAQVQVIRGQIGELENVRTTLGLSARKICQLLMVDPSAWNRWTKRGDTAPPHIYRTLQFYMIIQDKIPGLTPYYFLGRESANRIVADRISSERYENIQRQVQTLKKYLKILSGVFIGFIFLAAITLYFFIAAKYYFRQ